MLQLSEAAEVAISDRIEPIAGAASYSGAEYSLVYKPMPTAAEVNARRSASGTWRQSGRRILVTSGFVTLTFDGEPLAFTELDAYANDARWVEREIALPDASGSGALVLTTHWSDDDRLSLAGEPVFEVDRSHKALRIAFTERSDSYFQIGTALYAGVTAGRLGSLILSEVLFA
jgi:hypothetical protein